MSYIELLEKIKKYEIITIFRHVNPDPDAFGAQFGLKYWLELNFPEKTIFALGNDNSNDYFFPIMDIVSDDIIKKSLAIIVDTAVSSRVDGNYMIADFTMKIDHHIDIDCFADINIVDIKSAATCQLLADMFFKLKDYKMNKNTAETLYRGLLTDTLAFKTSNTTSKTLLIASKLSNYDLDIPMLNRDMFDRSIDEFYVATSLRNKFIFKENNKLGYAIVNIDDVKRFNLTEHQIRSKVSEFNSIKELEIWCIFTQKIDGGNILYDGSLRSKTIALNEVANKYNGGGHKNACGVKDMNEKDVKNLLNDLKNLL